MQRACLLGTSLLLLLLTPAAQGADKEGQERAARKACLSGDYAKGVEILSDLFLDTKNPTYIFNQARCYEQNNHCDDAVSRFREYLRKAPNLKFSERTEVEEHISECERLLGKTQAPVAPVLVPAPAPVVAPTPPPPAPVLAPSPTPEPAAPLQLSTNQEPTPTAGESKGYGLLIAGLCTGLVGLGSIGVGIYYYDQAMKYSSRVSSGKGTQDDKDAGQHAENMQWIFYGFGGAAVAAGTVLTILGWPSSEPSTPKASFAPMVGPGLAGITAQGLF